ncbi:MAG TPA: metal-dependent phosphohydrolase [Nitrospirales bacterium]|nr:metal-dependent phosphohydrolase [Nitrospirales bacterium]HIO69197.1 metal-dependent phosphohydrolase [Nitrospirales bacterium]
MFSSTTVVIEAFIEELQSVYLRTYGLSEPAFPDVIGFVGRMALEKISSSDAPYHDVNHTILVTEVGQEILRGKHLRLGGVSPRDWLHFIISLLCHDIGYVRGVCEGDHDGQYVIDADGQCVTMPAGATDASLTPYHVDRAKLFVEQRFRDVDLVDVEMILANIEHTRFPVPEEKVLNNDERGYPSLLRAADLIGQLADIDYQRKSSALFAEFVETGMAETLGYRSSADLRENYPKFYWDEVSPLIQVALRYLRETQEGKRWIAVLYANVFEEEHHVISFGVERRR